MTKLSRQELTCTGAQHSRDSVHPKSHNLAEYIHPAEIMHLAGAARGELHGKTESIGCVLRAWAHLRWGIDGRHRQQRADWRLDGCHTRTVRRLPWVLEPRDPARAYLELMLKPHPRFIWEEDPDMSWRGPVADWLTRG